MGGSAEVRFFGSSSPCSGLCRGRADFLFGRVLGITPSKIYQSLIAGRFLLTPWETVRRRAALCRGSRRVGGRWGSYGGLLASFHCSCWSGRWWVGCWCCREAVGVNERSSVWERNPRPGPRTFRERAVHDVEGGLPVWSQGPEEERSALKDEIERASDGATRAGSPEPENGCPRRLPPSSPKHRRPPGRIDQRSLTFGCPFPAIPPPFVLPPALPCSRPTPSPPSLRPANPAHTRTSPSPATSDGETLFQFPRPLFYLPSPASHSPILDLFRLSSGARRRPFTAGGSTGSQRRRDNQKTCTYVDVVLVVLQVAIECQFKRVGDREPAGSVP